MGRFLISEVPLYREPRRNPGTRMAIGRMYFRTHTHTHTHAHTLAHSHTHTLTHSHTHTLTHSFLLISRESGGHPGKRRAIRIRVHPRAVVPHSGRAGRPGLSRGVTGWGGAPDTRNPKPHTPNPKPETPNPKPGARSPKVETRTRKPEPRRNTPKNETRNPNPEKIQNPKPRECRAVVMLRLMLRQMRRLIL